PTWNSVNVGLSRLLLGRAPDDPVVPQRLPAGLSVAEARPRLAAWEQAGGLVLEHVQPPQRAEAIPSSPAAPDAAMLVARVLDRQIDTQWRRTSYSGLVRAAEGVATVRISEPEEAGTVDEDSSADDDVVAPAPSAPREGPPSPMADLPAGAGFGSLIHGVLEHADPQAADLGAELAAVVGEQLRWWPVDASVEDLVAGLLPVHDTSLGPIADGATLRDLGFDDRLRELDFEIPLAGGDRPDVEAAEVRLGQMGDVLRRHLPADDPLAGYADHLGGPLGEQALRGYLSGSIDVVLRVGPPTAQRYVVVDYKTNRLGGPDRPLTALDYTPTAMAESMTHSHYPLQALLYSVVVHRFLRWRLAGYDPETHLGGIAYLYVRGMCGPATPIVEGMPCGVFTWRPPAAAIVELSDLLAGRATGTAS
ncbi:MAG: exodeoxyribonuclease V subunit beta, partial [Aeromicrobium sp.]